MEENEQGKRKAFGDFGDATVHLQRLHQHKQYVLNPVMLHC